MVLESCPVQYACDEFFPVETQCPSPDDDPCMDEELFRECLELEARGCLEFSFSGCPMEIECEEFEPDIIIDPWVPPVFTTVNQIYVLAPKDVVDPATDPVELEVTGNVTLGKPQEGKQLCLVLHLVAKNSD